MKMKNAMMMAAATLMAAGLAHAQGETGSTGAPADSSMSSGEAAGSKETTETTHVKKTKKTKKHGAKKRTDTDSGTTSESTTDSNM